MADTSAMAKAATAAEPTKGACVPPSAENTLVLQDDDERGVSAPDAVVFGAVHVRMEHGSGGKWPLAFANVTVIAGGNVVGRATTDAYGEYLVLLHRPIWCSTKRARNVPVDILIRQDEREDCARAHVKRRMHELSDLCGVLDQAMSMWEYSVEADESELWTSCTCASLSRFARGSEARYLLWRASHVVLLMLVVMWLLILVFRCQFRWSHSRSEIGTEQRAPEQQQRQSTGLTTSTASPLRERCVHQCHEIQLRDRSTRWHVTTVAYAPGTCSVVITNE